jgi:hypothetical protein
MFHAGNFFDTRRSNLPHRGAPVSKILESAQTHSLISLRRSARKDLAANPDKPSSFAELTQSIDKREEGSKPQDRKSRKSKENLEVRSHAFDVLRDHVGLQIDSITGAK